MINNKNICKMIIGDKEYEIREKYNNIFGEEFVKNNKNICKMIIDDKEYEINEKYNIVKDIIYIIISEQSYQNKVLLLINIFFP